MFLHGVVVGLYTHMLLDTAIEIRLIVVQRWRHTQRCSIKLLCVVSWAVVCTMPTINVVARQVHTIR